MSLIFFLLNSEEMMKHICRIHRYFFGKLLENIHFVCTRGCCEVLVLFKFELGLRDRYLVCAHSTAADDACIELCVLFRS